MNLPNKYELQHAVRYATEQTRQYMMQRYPHAHMKVRPATQKDYYIPSSLSSKCIVVEKISFTKTGCLSVGCFPFKYNGSPCKEGDTVQWIPVGSNHATLSCQPRCWLTSSQIDTEWVHGKCMAVNPLKKLLANFPEKAFGQTSKHPLHAGLTWKNGHVYLNSTYCFAYGLEFDSKNCYSPTGQTILEFLLGKTVYRAIKTANVQPPKTTLPTLIPAEVQKGFQEIPHITDLTQTSSASAEIAKEIATELAFDVGLDISAHVVETILRKKAPKLILKATSNIPVKSALVQAVLHETVSMSVRSLMTLGKVLSGVNAAFAVYSIVSVIVDVIDPLNYDSVLTAKMLEDINMRLDFMYFGRENESMREVTPETIWELNEGDESERYEFMAEKVEEYLLALRQTDNINYIPKKSLFNFQIDDKIEHWNWIVHLIIMIMLSIFAFVWVEYIHIWGVFLWCVLFYFTTTK